MPDLVRGELMLAKKDFKRVLEYDLNSHGLAEALSGDIILPDLLRMKGRR